MAGEHVFHPFDRARFRTLLPLLTELDAASALSSSSRQQLEDLFRGAPQSVATASDVANRVLSSKRVSPRDLDLLIDFVVRACIPSWGALSLSDSAGPSWAVLDEVQRRLMDERWFDNLINGRAGTCTDLPFPRRGERLWREVTPDGLSRMKDGLRVVLDSPALPADHRAELAALQSFVCGATAKTGVVFACLL
ncbi:MAG: hypothetical protein QM765_30210 [Myxococcales bacterium]